jgi:hypothetical protein
MMGDLVPTEGFDVEAARAELLNPDSRRRRIAEKFFMAALGSLPWVGGFISAAASIPGDEGAEAKETLQSQWLAANQDRLDELGATLREIEARLENFGPEIEERIQSESYLALVRRTFRAWDRAETQEKRKYTVNLITNAAGYRLTSDDVVRLFIDWLDMYHEAHFAIIRELFRTPGSTRYDMWMAIHGQLVREDSAEADLFKMLIRDLSTGGVLRQARDTDDQGRFLRRVPQRGRGPSPRTMESAFEDEKPYVLTELGKQFVHYTMNEVVPRVGSGTAGS